LKGEAEAHTESLSKEREELMDQLVPLMLHNRRQGHYANPNPDPNPNSDWRQGHYSVLGRNVTKLMEPKLRQTPYT